YLQLKEIKEKQNCNDIKYIKTLDRNDLNIFSEKLPFKYTNSQKEVISTIFNDFLLDKASNTILIGDVSSGKTIVALSLCFCMIKQGYKVVFMVPTEILANQIELEMNKYLDCALVLKLTSSTSKIHKKTLLKKLKSDKPYIVVGTHALIEDDVTFNNLGLIVIDEQQRFGVIHRQKMIDKSVIAEVLYLTATPIPRSLSHALFGITQTKHLTEKPLKSTVKTTITKSFEKVITLIKNHVENKRQVFVITPLVEKNDDTDLFDAINVKKELQKVFIDFNVGIITGNMKSKIKQKVMNEVNEKKIDILVATSILEVGIDVKNATCIVVLNAERFGLSQLHQLRGRIGRNKYSNECMLYSDSKNTTSVTRLSNMLKYDNGYELAKMDLQSRGSGDVLGIKQSGNPDFKIFNIMFDMDIVEEVIKNNS
ncbi:MAG: DEAD/DEAH box helicase, partial [Mycoplasmatales bacterium]